jgi:hypothetical protein
MALRQLASTAAMRDRLEDAALLLGASRRNMPSWGLEPAVYGPLEEQCRDGLGVDRFEALAEHGATLTHAELLDLVDDRAGAASDVDTPSGPAAS